MVKAHDLNQMNDQRRKREKKNRQCKNISPCFKPNTFKLQTKFITCEHFAGRHTNDRVAYKFKSIFDRYDITNKIYFVTTDGGSEYVAAFKYHADNYRSLHLSNRHR